MTTKQAFELSLYDPLLYDQWELDQRYLRLFRTRFNAGKITKDKMEGLLFKIKRAKFTPGKWTLPGRKKAFLTKEAFELALYNSVLNSQWEVEQNYLRGLRMRFRSGGITQDLMEGLLLKIENSKFKPENWTLPKSKNLIKKKA